MKQYTLAIAAAFALAATACSGPQPPDYPRDELVVRDARGTTLRIEPVVLDVTLHGDVRFTDHERRLIEQACSNWHYVSGGFVMGDSNFTGYIWEAATSQQIFSNATFDNIRADINADYGTSF